MTFNLEDLFKTGDEDFLEWNRFVDDLIKKYNLCTGDRTINEELIELWCYDDDLAKLFSDFGIGIGMSFNVEKVFKVDNNYQPVGLNYGDYIETVELIQNGNVYHVPVYCAYNGTGADYAFALFEAEKGE